MSRAERLEAGMSAQQAGAADLAARLASRMCHDLVSPLGAIGNGLELLEMSGEASGPEHALIAESVAAATTRLRLFRLAFGHAGAGQRLPVAELRDLLADRDAAGRLTCRLEAEGDLSRRDAQLIVLAVMCLATGLPWGGRVLICRAETGPLAGAASGWRLVAEAERTRPDPGLWAWLEGAHPGPLPAPGEVHFALLGMLAAGLGQPLRWELDASGAEISF